MSRLYGSIVDSIIEKKKKRKTGAKIFRKYLLTLDDNPPEISLILNATSRVFYRFIISFFTAYRFGGKKQFLVLRKIKILSSPRSQNTITIVTILTRNCFEKEEH